jgi:galactose mutarotase-like enzyme
MSELSDTVLMPIKERVALVSRRFGNRIGDGKFSLEGRDCTLSAG